MLVNLLSYEAPYLGPEVGRPVGHTCPGKLGMVKIFKIAPHKQKSIVKKKLAGKWAPWPTGPCA